jgi:uncharacterized spore protein YtfJ
MQAPEFKELIGGVRDMITVKRVYGDPYEHNGLTLIPAASVRGGAGGGEGKRGEGETGVGGGLGITARPSGAWVIKDGDAEWKPAIDVNRIVMGGQIVGLAAILVVGRILNAQSRRERQRARTRRLALVAGAQVLALARRLRS